MAFCKPFTISAAAVGMFVVLVNAGQAQETSGFLTQGGALDQSDPDLVFSLGAGVGYSPAYPGSSDLEFDPTGSVQFDYIRFPLGFTFRSGRSIGFTQGFGLQGSARYIRERDSGDYSEIDGLDDVDTTLELGLGVVYEQSNYRAFANARYGFLGHEAFVGEVGADLIVRPIDGLTLSAGPRLDLGDNKFADTYFGVSQSGSAASGLAAYNADGGIVSAGLEVIALYQFNPRWGLRGEFKWDRLVGDAEDSPITRRGDENQYQIKLELVRSISFRF